MPAVAIGPETGPEIQNDDAVKFTASRRYGFPDLPADAPRFGRFSRTYFSAQPGVVIVGDYTGFSQNAANIGQIGEQASKFELRSLRLSLVGGIGSNGWASYQIAAEYKGFESEPAQSFQLTDLAITIPIDRRTRITLGKTKQSFGYEASGDTRNLPQNERATSPFVLSRNFGLRLNHVLGADRRATVALGLYNEAWDFNGATANNGLEINARVTGLVWVTGDASRYLHLGASWRRIPANASLHYRGRPETNIGDNFIDTGEFAASGANHYNVEALLGLGPVSVLAEVVTAAIDAPAVGNPHFGGWTLTASWVPTGESRPYDRNVGYARRIIPTGHWGAPEFVARLSRNDLDDGDIRGGRWTRASLGANWWATTRWRLGVNWGHVWLDRDGTKGQADLVLTRVQWVY